VEQWQCCNWDAWQVVEARGTEAEQAAALRVLLRAGRSDARLRAQLPSVLPLLRPVLRAPCALASHRLLQVTNYYISSARSQRLSECADGSPLVN
jgi:hypothetical protein